MICFLVTTYNRPDSCRELVLELSRHGDVYVVNDGSTLEYNLEISKYPVYIIKQAHNGKVRYWDTVNKLFAFPVKTYDYYFMIPDDFIPVDGFVQKAIESFRGICLTTYTSEARGGKECWTHKKVIDCGDVWLTGWTDMCFVCKKKFFDELGVIPPVVCDWGKDPKLSSGVGAYISRYLWGLEIYQIKKSLFIPREIPSQMNSWRDIDDPLNKPML
jgi:glycosyltransferase involved in cell wall biosynthesis